jgi:hypothetical protein
MPLFSLAAVTPVSEVDVPKPAVAAPEPASQVAMKAEERGAEVASPQIGNILPSKVPSTGAVEGAKPSLTVSYIPHRPQGSKLLHFIGRSCAFPWSHSCLTSPLLCRLNSFQALLHFSAPHLCIGNATGFGP